MIEERACLGIKPPYNKKKSPRKTASASSKKQMDSLKKYLNQFKLQIASLTKSKRVEDENSDKTPDDAGNSFGGRKKKRAKKNE